MKKAVLIVLSCMLILCSCGKTEGVEKTLNAYIKGLQEFDFELMDSCMAEKPEEIDNDFAGPVYAYVIEKSREISLESKDISINGNTAIANVSLSFPDSSDVLLPAMQRYIEIVAASDSHPATEEGNKLLSECIEAVNIKPEILNVKGEIYFERVKSEWKITDMSEELVAVIGCNYLETFENLL